MTRKFNGVVNLDVRDSVADWTPFRESPAPDGAPNVLLVLYDDTGMAAWSPYGGRINMPTMQRLADNGLTYTQWHTTALCSPTRSCLLTGRNHHQNGFAQIAEGAQGFPGHTGHIPMENATIGEVLRENGYNTFWVGKNHNVPLDEWAMGATKRNWPLARLRPLLRLHRRRDQQLVPDAGRGQPLRRPARAPGGGLPPLEGPCGQGDLVHRGQQDVRAGEALVPVVLPGRQPRTAPRARRVHRQVRRAVRRRLRGLPRVGAAPDGRAWRHARGHGPHRHQPAAGRCRDPGRPRAAVERAERRGEAAVRAVRRGVRRLLGVHRRPGRPDHRLPRGDRPAREHDRHVCGRQRRLRRGQSGRDGQREQVLQCLPRGPRAEPRHARPARLAGHVQPLPDRLGDGVLDAVQDVQALHLPGRRRRPPGDLVARRHRREGRGAPPVPPRRRHRADRPRVRRAGDARRGPRVRPDRAPGRLDEVQLRRGRSDPEGGPVLRDDGYPRPVAPGLARGGATRTSAGCDGGRLRERDLGAVPLRRGPGEAHDLAGQYPDKVKELVNLWYVEAGKYDVLPLDNRSIAELVRDMPVQDIPEGGIYRYYPDTLPVPEFNAAELRGRSYKILAQVEITDADAEGVIIANGARFGGHSLFVKDHRLWYAYNFLGIPPEQQVTSPDEITVGPHVLGAEFAKESVGEHGEAIGTVTLYVDDVAVAKAPWKTQPGHFALCGEGLTVGRDSSDPVSKEYGPPFAFSGGRIREVQIAIGDDQYVDLERDFRAAMSRD